MPEDQLGVEQDSDSEDEIVGTEHYVAPETLRYEKPGFATDLWSLAVIIYQMLSGELPFDGKDEDAVY